MDVIFTTALGLVLRALPHALGFHDTRLAAALIGLWEGGVLYRALGAARDGAGTDIDVYLGFALRLMVDLAVAGGATRVMIVALWAAVGLAAGEIGGALFEDSGRKHPRHRDRERTTAHAHHRHSSSRRRAVSTSRTDTTQASRVHFEDSPESVSDSPAPTTPSDREQTWRQIPRTRPRSKILPSISRAQSELIDTPLPPLNSLTPSSGSPVSPPTGHTGWTMIEDADIPDMDASGELEYLDEVSVPPRRHDAPATIQDLRPPSPPPPRPASPTPPRRRASSRPRSPFSDERSEAVSSGMEDGLSSPSVASSAPLTRPSVFLAADPSHAAEDHSPGSTMRMLPPMLGSPHALSSQPLAISRAPSGGAPEIRVSLPPPHSTGDGADAGSARHSVLAVPLTEDEAAILSSAAQDGHSLVTGPSLALPGLAASTSGGPPSLSLAVDTLRIPRARRTDLVSPARTEAESVLSDVNSRVKLLYKAEVLRGQARAQEGEAERIERERQTAVRAGRPLAALSLKVKRDEAAERAKRLHKRAARRYHRAHNLVPMPNVVDIHGLKVREAIRVVERGVRDAMIRRSPQLRVITGRGKHSVGGIPVLKAAVIDTMKGHHIPVRVNPNNPGELWIDLHPPAKIK